MVSPKDAKPLTENIVLYFLYCQAKKRGSKVFFKIKHTLSLERISGRSPITWFYFAPDVDMLEITPDNEIIGYETKGQRKGKTGYKWPSLYQGLDEALFYLRLPYIRPRELEGGVIDKVFVVHAHPSPEKIEKDEKLGLRIYELTPIGFICVMPQGKIIKLVEAKNNPLLDRDAKTFFLQNLDTLENFSENSRTFRQIRERGEDFLK
jgi:hypothetical protein